MTFIQTNLYSERLRNRALQVTEKRILIAQLSGSEQEKDLTEPVNCQGFGRIRHFRFQKESNWSSNPLPILPACQALGLPHASMMPAQVFQLAACNWRCWYCFVDFAHLSASMRFGQFLTADELIHLYLQEQTRPLTLDLSGGQPDIIPEWTLWTMEALVRHGLEGKVFLWSDDNLSTRYFWTFLDREQRKRIVRFPKYARVGCFKGYDEASFAFNTAAPPELFSQQFEIYRDLLKEGLDMYAYVTLTAVPHAGLEQSMAHFFDRLQEIHPHLPLRTIPLKIAVFTTTGQRLKARHEQALSFQYDVHDAWLEELQRRFSPEELALPIYAVSLML